MQDQMSSESRTRHLEFPFASLCRVGECEHHSTRSHCWRWSEYENGGADWMALGSFASSASPDHGFRSDKPTVGTAGQHLSGGSPPAKFGNS